MTPLPSKQSQTQKKKHIAFDQLMQILLVRVPAAFVFNQFLDKFLDKMSDLILTIEDDEEGDANGNLSEDSASDEELQPTRKRARTGTSKAGGLDPTFDFGQFAKDVWADRLVATATTKVKRERTSLDQKIKKRLGGGDAVEEIEIKDEESEDSDVDDEDEIEDAVGYGSKANGRKSQEEDDDIDLSDDELEQDRILLKGKGKMGGRKQQKTVAEDVDDDDDDNVEENQGLRLENDPTFAYDSDASFQQMNLSRPLLKAITSLGFVHPTPIQAAAIPVGLAGRDICGCASTGTGKTAAYMLPVLERLLYKPKLESITRVLCLVPTRELGVQVYQVTKNLCSFSNDIQVGLAVGGLDIQQQESILRQSPDIVIATPGRLIDHLGNTPSFTLSSIEILILDEADRMLDEWFAEQLKQIVKQCSPRRQTLLFSATMTDKVKDLATVSLTNPCRIFVDSNKQVAFNLRQQIVKVRNESDREAILCATVVRTFHSKTMVFVPTKKIAHRLHVVLGLMGIRIGELHGDLGQTQRLDALKKFQNSETDVLIVTDVAARGLDIPGVQSVVNFTMPPTLEQYIHRCGRTARAGRSGVAVSLVGENDRKLMKQVAKAATNAVKSRIIPPEIIGKYRDKLTSMESEIESIFTEEEAEKTIVKAEIEANKALRRLKEKSSKKKKKGRPGQAQSSDKGRVWFQSAKDRKDESERLKGRNPAKLRKAIASAQEDMQIRKLVDFQKRQAKGKRKGRKTAEADDGSNRTAKKRSFFDDEITNVSKAKAFRHQPKSFKPQKPSINNSKPKLGDRDKNANKSGKKFSRKMNNKKR